MAEQTYIHEQNQQVRKKILNMPQGLMSLYRVLVAYILYLISELNVYICLTIVILCLLIDMSRAHLNVFIMNTLHMNGKIIQYHCYL